MSKITMRKKSFQWHLLFAWFAGFALLAFCISGITHPILAWTGPQSSAFMPPRAAMQADQVNVIQDILKRHNIEQAIVVKLVPSARGVVLQVTEDNDQARRYFDLTSFDELINYDQQQAEWLARYYALGGDKSVPVESIIFQTEFDHSYPWVNRLLPVYKVTFANEQNLSTYVYTEINALAGLSNDYKTTLQSIFRNLHTWSWLNNVDNARILIMACNGYCLGVVTKDPQDNAINIAHSSLYGLWALVALIGILSKRFLSSTALWLCRHSPRFRAW